ncbi:MAG TPA: hypothetical protein VE650_05230 [Acetobacteraceae bacterium]|nr:hypothetical protein [Acetobacteraceae bacterium]
MTNVISADVVDWARDLAAIRDLLAGDRQSGAARVSLPRETKPGMVVVMPWRSAPRIGA